MSSPLVIENLYVTLGQGPRPVHALRGVDLALAAGQVTGLVGETGSGKSLTALAAIGLLPPTARISSGSIRLYDQELLGQGAARWQAVRGRQIAMIFQNARAALHPLIPVGEQIAGLHRLHHRSSRAAARRAAVAMLEAVGLPEAEKRMRAYPHQLSGGQCQRVLIAMALTCRPQIILADEPTSGLDVTVQQQVLATLMQHVRDAGMTMLLISHDMAVIQQTCDNIAVMYAGQVVEFGPREQVFEQAVHPYTKALLACLRMDQRRMAAIPGSVPDLRLPIAGCAFAGRCPEVTEDCWTTRPEPRLVGKNQTARCILYGVTEECEKSLC